MSHAAAVDEPARRTPLYGSYDVVVLGGGPAGIAAAACAARGAARARCWSSATASSAAWGRRPASPTSAACTPTSTATIRRVVHGVADELLARMRGARRPERAAPDLRQDLRPGLRQRGVQVRRRRDAARRRRRAAVPCARGRRRRWRRRPHRRARRRDQVGALRDPRPRPSSTAPATATSPTSPACAMQPGGALLFPTLMFRVANVDAARAGEAWRTIPALMDEAEAAGEFRFPRKGRDRQAAEARRRVARQRHAAEERRRQRGRRHRRAIAQRRRGRGPAPGDRLPRVPAPARSRLRSGVPARDRAAARHPRDAPAGRASTC